MQIVDRSSTLAGRLANRRALIASGALCVALALVLFASSGRFSLAAVEANCGRPAPDAHITTSPSAVEEFIAGCGEAGRSAYRDVQLVDLVYPAVIGVFMASCLAFLLPQLVRGREHVRALALLPVLGALLDYLENIGAWLLLVRIPQEATAAAWLVSLASPAKQAVNWVSSLVLLTCLVVVSTRWAISTVAGRARARRVGGVDQRATADRMTMKAGV